VIAKLIEDDEFICYIQGIPVTTGKNKSERQEMRYYAAVFRKPVTSRSKPTLSCGHAHWTREEAEACATRLLEFESGDTV
jgi:hypothetical protein